MPCNHRFLEDLNPDYPLSYLFIGTFNPAWNRQGNDNANWFYGRRYNDFWFIMPQVFGHASLMPPQFRNNREFLMNWCHQNHIGITDLIQCVNDADFNNEEHKEIILSVDDNGFDVFDQVIPNNVLPIIESNISSLRGVYLTRFDYTLPQGGIIMELWSPIKERCIQLGIHCDDLVTPSRQFRRIKRTHKLKAWNYFINS